jgi:predicted ABC-type sugar transport system permease subunit
MRAIYFTNSSVDTDFMVKNISIIALVAMVFATGGLFFIMTSNENKVKLSAGDSYETKKKPIIIKPVQPNCETLAVGAVPLINLNTGMGMTSTNTGCSN